jgi:hypothetical protein
VPAAVSRFCLYLSGRGLPRPSRSSYLSHCLDLLDEVADPAQVADSATSWPLPATSSLRSRAGAVPRLPTSPQREWTRPAATAGPIPHPGKRHCCALSPWCVAVAPAPGRLTPQPAGSTRPRSISHQLSWMVRPYGGTRGGSAFRSELRSVPSYPHARDRRGCCPGNSESNSRGVDLHHVNTCKSAPPDRSADRRSEEPPRAVRRR